MQAFDIDYAHSNKTWSPIWPMIVLALIALAGYLLWQHDSQLSDEIEQLQTELALKKTPEVIASRPEIDETVRLAHQLESKLNTDWIGLLSALESIHTEHSLIKLTHLKPDLKREQLVLNGLAKEFETIAAYTKSLEQTTLFNNVALRSQYSSVEHPDYIQFQLIMEWQP